MSLSSCEWIVQQRNVLITGATGVGKTFLACALMAGLAGTDLLVLDDWGLAPLGGADRRELLEIFEDRHELRSTLVTSQLPVDAYRVALRGESMRRKKAAKAQLSS